MPFFLAGLCHPVPGVKKLAAKALLVLGLGGGRSQGGGGGGGGDVVGGGRGRMEEDGERANRCRQLLQPPLLPALVSALGDGDTGAAQVCLLRHDGLYSVVHKIQRRNPILFPAYLGASCSITNLACPPVAVPSFRPLPLPWSR